LNWSNVLNISERGDSTVGKVITFQNISKELASHRNQKIIFTNGCFDLLHVGHVRYLQEARAQGDLLVVGVNSDASVKRLKGPTRPIQVENDRAEILAALRAVDYVVIFEEDTPAQLIEQVRPNVLVKGGDWKPEQIVGSSFVLSYGGEVKSLQFVEGRSTTKIIEKSK
jgi:D-beta-D-heptose 7-phosphate kinase/D-beta-D-heptose 1-phosphate adenosyltransferase